MRHPTLLLAVVLAVTAFPVASRELAAQACSPLPVRADEGWAALADEGVDVGQRLRLTGAVNVRDRVVVQGDGRWGGYVAEGTASELGTRVGVPLHRGALDLCPYVAFSALSYSFLDQFDVDRGDVDEQALRTGVGVATPLPDGPGPHFGVTAEVEYVYRHWDMTGRKLVVRPDTIGVQTIHHIVPTHHMAGRVGGTMRWGRAALVTGVGTYPRTGNDLVWYLGVGFLAGVF